MGWMAAVRALKCLLVLKSDDAIEQVSLSISGWFYEEDSFWIACLPLYIPHSSQTLWYWTGLLQFGQEYIVVEEAL